MTEAGLYNAGFLPIAETQLSLLGKNLQSEDKIMVIIKKYSKWFSTLIENGLFLFVYIKRRHSGLLGLDLCKLLWHTEPYGCHAMWQIYGASSDVIFNF
jgi:hypothetical protein